MKQIKILIVEDDDDLRLMLKKSFESQKKNSYEIDLASNGLNAIEHLTIKNYDWVITNFRMPLLGSQEWISFLQKFIVSYGTRIIIISGYFDSVEISPNIIKIPKPFKFDELHQLINEAEVL